MKATVTVIEIIKVSKFGFTLLVLVYKEFR